MREWWRGAVIYQIYPRSFQDDTGDGVGDLKGIARRLGHVARLGADAVWLSPIFPSPMEDMGYDVSDYTDVDPLFGTLADFDALIAEAHGLGLKVIIDQVISHTSSQHPWFAASRAARKGPKADWYVWADPRPDGTPPTNWPSVFGGPAWTWDATRRQYYMHNFLSTQPDLNFHNPEVQEALLSVMEFWLDRGVDGFRLDTVNYYFHDARLRDNPALPRQPGELPPGNPYDMQDHIYSKSRPENLGFLKKIRALTDRYSDRMLVGEVGDNLRAVQLMGEYTSGSDRLHMAYSFDMLSPDFSPAHFRGVIERFYTGGPEGWPCWSFSNHDVNRHVTRWAGHAKDREALARQAAALLLAFEGSICLYQAEELGQTETDILWEELTDPVGMRFWPDNKGRDGCRTPMVWERDAHAAGFTTGEPWLPVKPPQRARAVSEQEGKAGSVLEFYREMLAFRKETPAFLDRGTAFLDLPAPLLGFTRGSGEAAVTCLYNLSAKSVKLPVKALSGLAPFGPGQGTGGKGSLGPNGFVFLRRA